MSAWLRKFCSRTMAAHVTTPARQYGTSGKMQGKKFMTSATWNAPREAFDNPNGELYGGKGTADLFLHNVQLQVHGL
jgi:putative NADPH-quinone reductase